VALIAIGEDNKTMVYSVKKEAEKTSVEEAPKEKNSNQ
jgi:hypothetical protein